MALFVTNTVGNICTQALGKLNVIDDRNSVPAEDMEVAAKELQLMLKSWALEGAPIWMRREATINTVDGTAGYDLSANTVTTQEIIQIAILENGDSVQSLLTPISRQQYLALTDRTTEGKPVHWWPQFTNTDEDFTLWPVPDAVYNLKVDYRLSYTNQDERTDTLEIPDYMLDATIWGLAARLLPEHGMDGTPRGEHVMMRAADLYATAMAFSVIQDGGGEIQFRPDWR